MDFLEAIKVLGEEDAKEWTIMYRKKWKGSSKLPHIFIELSSSYRQRNTEGRPLFSEHLNLFDQWLTLFEFVEEDNSYGSRTTLCSLLVYEDYISDDWETTQPDKGDKR